MTYEAISIRVYGIRSVAKNITVSSVGNDTTTINGRTPSTWTGLHGFFTVRAILGELIRVAIRGKLMGYAA